jgi:hypothetical protein
MKEVKNYTDKQPNTQRLLDMRDILVETSTVGRPVKKPFMIGSDVQAREPPLKARLWTPSRLRKPKFVRDFDNDEKEYALSGVSLMSAKEAQGRSESCLQKSRMTKPMRENPPSHTSARTLQISSEISWHQKP